MIKIPLLLSLKVTSHVFVGESSIYIAISLRLREVNRIDSLKTLKMRFDEPYKSVHVDSQSTVLLVLNI